MSFETTRLPLTNALIPICASYLTPPESRYIAAHQPADQTAAALFAQFREAYNSQAMWDHLALSRGMDAGPGSRAGVTAHYQALNTRVLAYLNSDRLDHDGPPLPMPEGDPFLANARLQGLLIGRLIGNPYNRAPFPPLERPVAEMVLHMAFSPMRAVSPMREVGEEVLAEDFYGTILGHSFRGRILMGLDIHPHIGIPQDYQRWNGFLGACLVQHGFLLFLEYGGLTKTLKAAIAQLLNLSRQVDHNTIEKHLDQIKFLMGIDLIREDLDFFDLLNQIIENRSSEIACLRPLIKLLRDEMILRGPKIPKGPRKGQAFNDHYLLACAQDKKNEAVIIIAKELIDKLQNASSERPAAAGAGAAAAGAGAGAAAAAGK